jgi:uncharacterized protein
MMNHSIKSEEIKKNKIILTVFILIISINYFLSSEKSHHVYLILLAIFLVYYLIRKEWFEVSVALSFLLFATIPIICLPIIIFFIIAFSTPVIRKTLAWIKIGQQNTISKILILLTSIISIISLLIWAANSDYLGLGIKTIKGFLAYNHLLVFILFIPIFAIVNALIEEFMFRGILQESLRKNFNNKLFVIILQALPFAAFHYAAGFPNGITGVFMVFIWGAVLGYLREKTNGLLAPVICHLVADLTIGYYLFYSALQLAN